MNKNTKLLLSAGLIAAMAAAGTALAADSPTAPANGGSQVQEQPQAPAQGQPGFGPGGCQGQGKGFGSGKMRGHMQGHGPGMMEGKGAMGPGMMGMNEELLALLQMDRETLMQEHRSGKSLVEIAASKGVTEQQLIDALVKHRTTELDAAVEAGRLTKEQADQMKAQLPEWAKQHVNQKPVGPKGSAPDRSQPQQQSTNS